MESTLTYPFERKSENYLDWLMNTIRSQNYYMAEVNIKEIENRYL